MTVKVGIMQGRLTPPQYGTIQSFPADGWRGEFSRARDAGLASIEWIYEVRNETRNPLGSPEGVAEMLALAETSGVAVWSVCADYYMERHLVGADGRINADHLDHLKSLIKQVAMLGARYIVLPFVDASSLGSWEMMAGLRDALAQVAPLAEATGVELHLETDLAPEVFAGLLATIGHGSIRANYDIGNSAALGYIPAHELDLLGRFIGSVHVKDRLRGGTTVPLGAGNADFSACFDHFERIGFDRWFILQVAREEGLSEVELAIRNRQMVERWVRERKVA